MDKALTQSGADQQSTWNECFDLLAENVPLYPVLFAKTSTASWAKPNGNGVALQGFKGIGTTGMSFVDVNTVYPEVTEPAGLYVVIGLRRVNVARAFFFLMFFRGGRV